MSLSCWDLDQHRARALAHYGSIVVDVGASTGEFAIPAALTGATVLCVEVLPDNCAALVNAGLDVLQAAAGPSDGRCALIEGEGASRATGSHIEPDPDGSVPMVSLATIVQSAGGQIDVLKVDIEGGEYGLFATADKAVMEQIEHLAVEFHTWTTPDEPRREGVGVRSGSPYPRGAASALVAKLAETHHVEVSGALEAGGVIWGDKR